MSSRDYRFVTRWRVYGTPGEVFAVLSDPLELARWWPSVYLAVAEIEPGGPDGVGRRVALLTRGWLPYTLAWVLRVSRSEPPHSLTVEAEGDLTGRGIWTLESDGAWVLVTFEWEVRADKPLLAILSPLMSPVLAANHRWAMARGGESLERELARRRALPSERDALPPPPPAARHTGLILAAGAAGALGLAVLAVQLLSPRRSRRFSLRG